MQYILVLQWPGTSHSDFDELIYMEDALTGALGPRASVDGHDFGSGEMNIFIETDEPIEAFAQATAALRSTPGWSNVRAAYRESMRDAYTILWPGDLSVFTVK